MKGIEMNQPSTAPAGALSGKLIVVTGAGQGIGKAYARRIAGEGARVALVDVNEQAISAAQTELDAEGLSVESWTVDVSRPDDVKRFAEELGRRHNAVHGLVNNAAVFSSLKLKPFWEIDPAEWDLVMAVNVRGPWLLVSALRPLLLAAPEASVINIGSDAVWMGKDGYLHYVASKAAVYGMTHAMARELGANGVRVNTLSPGFTATEVPRETFTQQQLDGIMRSQALKRIASTDDMVGVVSFLLGPDSRWVTGQTIHVTGGLLYR
jgi:NAD(P)-dependent dehydrogenase (short-subunit alcohol dehydrogenase family)